MPRPSDQPDRVVIGVAGLDQLIGALRRAGYQVLGPTVRNRAIVIEPIDSAADLPLGWGDSQDGGAYRLVERGDGALFGFAAPAGTWKRYLFPPRSVLWRAVRDDGGVRLEETIETPPPRALFGIRGCDLAAIEVQDKVFVHAEHPDPVYASRRAGLFLVGVNCSDPASTCFCTSMGTGPAVGPSADLVLTELDPDHADRHRFLLQVRTDRAAEVVAQLERSPATQQDLDASVRVTDQAVQRMQRTMNTESLPQLLAAAREHPRWDAVAQRCLACGNCTMQCPTCFCSDVLDEPDAVSGVDERVRHWASCFELGYSYIHGGPVRVSTKARYRQWLTHKLGTWWEQFDVSGCVGCGRCIAWCPVGIDITEEVRAIRGGEAVSTAGA